MPGAFSFDERPPLPVFKLDTNKKETDILSVSFLSGGGGVKKLFSHPGLLHYHYLRSLLPAGLDGNPVALSDA